MKNRQALLKKTRSVVATFLLTVSAGGCAQTVAQPKYNPRTAAQVARFHQAFGYEFATYAPAYVNQQKTGLAVNDDASWILLSW